MHLPTERCTARQIPERTFRTWEIPQEYWVYSVHPISGQINISNYWLDVCVYPYIYIYVCMLCISVYTVYIHIYIYIHISRYPRKQITFMLVETPRDLLFLFPQRQSRRWGCGFGASAGKFDELPSASGMGPGGKWMVFSHKMARNSGYKTMITL